MKLKIKAKKIGRNDPCPCGVGIKYKRCHGNVQRMNMLSELRDKALSEAQAKKNSS